MKTPVTLILIFVALAGCGGSSGGSSSSGIPRTTTFATLTAAQGGTLCDYVNGKQGGYGRSTVCSVGDTQTTDDSKTDCVSALSGLATLCPRLSVADIEDCVSAIGTDLCAFETDAACAPVLNCADSGGADAGRG
jgi:hypothetical protein